MDNRQFDRLAKSLAEAGTRRGLLRVVAGLPLLGGLAAFLDDDEVDARGRRKRRKKPHHHAKRRRGKHRKGKKKCQAKSRAIVCEDKCGLVKNNCKKTIDCGSCDCSPTCGLCLTCDAATLTCMPDPTQAGDSCGGAGQICQTDGTCACDVCASGCPYETIQDAIDDDATQDGDTISICAGSYLGSVNITKSITLEGVGDGADASANTILDGNLAGRVVAIGNTRSVTLRGLRVTRGRTSQNGAGIANFGALTMEDCTVFDNEANDDGGGIFQEDPATSLTATNCLIEQNKAIGSSSGGGGILSRDSPGVTLTDCVIRNNQSTSNVWRAGGIEFSPNAATTYTLTGCEVGPDNSAAVGAGIFAGSLANVILDDTTVQGNHAGFTGGGIQVEQGATLTLQNGSVVRDNDAASDGGGISSRGAVIIDDSTVGPTNTAGNRGGGIFNVAIPLGGILGTIDLSADSSIIDNHATIDGGGVLNQGTIDCNGDISGNTVGDPEAANNCIDDGAGEGCAACPA